MTQTYSRKEKLLIEFLLADRKVFTKAYSILKPSYFDPPLDGVIKMVLEFFKKHHGLPDVDTIEAETNVKLKKRELDESDESYLLDEIEEFCSRQAMTEAILAGVDIVNDDGDISQVQSLVREALLVKIDKALGTSLFDDPVQRLHDFEESRFPYTLGIPALDAMNGDQWYRGELYLFAAACVDSETEFLTPHGWKKIREYEDGDKVLQYNDDGEVSWITPKSYIKAESTGFYHFKTKYGIDQVVSANHRMPYLDYRGRIKIDYAENIKRAHEKLASGFRGKFITTIDAHTGGEGIGLSEGEIRLSVAVKADGRVVKEGKNNYTQMRFNKKRKYDRLIDICEKFDLRYSDRGINNQSQYEVIVWPKCADKLYSSWWMASKEDLEIICDEVRHWDGTVRKNGNVVFCSKHKENTDFIQYAFASCGVRSIVQQGTNVWETVTCNRSTVGLSAGSVFKPTINEYHDHDGFQYCFETLSGMWVARRNGRVFVTGNSGTGKSVMLANVAARLAHGNDKQEKLDALVVSVEMDEHPYSRRMDSIITGLPMKGVDIEDLAKSLEDKKDEYGSIITKRVGSRFGVDDLRAYLMEYHVQYGKYPDVLLLDYIDIFANGRNPGMSKFDWDEVKSHEIRDMLVEFDMLGFSASQLNRDSYTDIISVSPAHIAGGLSKVNASDATIAMIATDEDIDNNQLQCKGIKVRNAEKSAQMVTLYRCPRTLRISDTPFNASPKSTKSPVVDKKKKAQQPEPDKAQQPAKGKDKLKDAMKMTKRT